MIHWKIEGRTIKQGISIYPWSDTHHAGGVLRIGNHLWIARYSKMLKKFYFNHHTLNAIKIIKQKHNKDNHE